MDQVVSKKIDVIIPALNEEKSIGMVLQAIPNDWVRHVIVCDNGSTDGTAAEAQNNGAIVTIEKCRGYGSACLRAIGYLEQLPEKDQPDIVVFMDGDFSDLPEELPFLVQPIMESKAELVIGSRVLGDLQQGALQPQQIFGNWLATRLIHWFFGSQFTDLGPFRAITWKALNALQMQDRNFGWTVEMQVRAAKKRLKCKEVPVSYRKRIGRSKVSGTLKGTIMAGYKIIWTIFKLRFSGR